MVGWGGLFDYRVTSLALAKSSTTLHKGIILYIHHIIQYVQSKNAKQYEIAIKNTITSNYYKINKTYRCKVTVDGTSAATKRPNGRIVLKADDAASRGPPPPSKLKNQKITYELMTIRFGGMAARNNPIGRNAASAFKKSLKLSFPL